MSADAAGPSWLDLPLRRPLVTLLLVALVTAAALLLWPGVRFEPDVSRVLPPDHPHVRIAQLLDDRSRPARTLWILLRGDGLAERVPALAERLRGSPLVAAVDTRREQMFGPWLLRAASAPLWSLTPPRLDELAAALSPAGRARAIDSLRLDLADDPLAAAELATRDPLGLRWLLAADDPARQLGLDAGTDLVSFDGGRRALLRLLGTTDAYDADFSTALMQHVDAALAGTDAVVFGGYAVARSDQARIRADFERASVWAMVAILVYLCWVMRGIRLPLLVQLPALLSITWAIPFGSAWFGPLPTVAVAAVAVLCGLGVDFAIHYAARYRDERLRADHATAVRRVQRGIVPELTIDMATTAVTFLAVGSGQLSGLRAFGLLLALGLVASLLVTVTALPVLLATAGHRRDPERSWLAGAADRWLQHPAARRVAVAAIVVAAALALLVAGRGVPLRADPEALRPHADPVAAARATIEHELGFQTVPAVVLVPFADEPSGARDGLLALQRDGRIRFWSGLDAVETDAARRAVAACRARIGDFVGPALRQFAAAGLEPEAFRPALQDLAGRLAADPAPAPPLTLEIGGERWRALQVWPVARLDGEHLPQFVAAVADRLGPRAQVHAGATVAAELAVVLRSDLLRAVLLAAGLAFGMVLLWLRSARLGLLALLPSAVGMSVTLALLVAIDLQLSLVSFVAVPFVLGIGVDEGVHTVGHCRHGAGSTGATGTGVVRTSLGTVLGFGALLWADSPGLRDLGGIVAVGSLASMLACLFVLAPLLARRASAHQSRAQQNQ
ncbi:MAG: MMPL family transporter [Planctomycetes bacterium]|nr:MMPL family transporter [Planctomycetota bacterium]